VREQCDVVRRDLLPGLVVVCVVIRHDLPGHVLGVEHSLVEGFPDESTEFTKFRLGVGDEMFVLELVERVGAQLVMRPGCVLRRFHPGLDGVVSPLAPAVPPFHVLERSDTVPSVAYQMNELCGGEQPLYDPDVTLILRKLVTPAGLSELLGVRAKYGAVCGSQSRGVPDDPVSS